eukprot:2348265-Prymnesium_polylepis.3
MSSNGCCPGARGIARPEAGSRGVASSLASTSTSSTHAMHWGTPAQQVQVDIASARRTTGSPSLSQWSTRFHRRMSVSPSTNA